jgi:erythromycin esterase
MKIHLCSIILLFVIFPTTVFCQHQEGIKWIDENAVKIKTVRAENGFEDLMPLKNIFKDTRIIALGEATHGTKEIFQMKHRMLEFLVKEMGFRYFAVEANLTETYAVNDYVMYGRGDPQKALDGLYFWTLNTKEVMAMIQWMRGYNKDKEDKDKVRFYGFDMQAQPVAMSEFYKYISRVDSGYAFQIKDLVSRIQGFGDGVPDNNAVKSCAGEVEKLFTHINDKKEKYISTTSEREYETEKHNLVVVSQYIAMMSETDTAVMCQTRDSCMCENVKWFMDLEGDASKFVLWAHNGHIAKDYVDSDGLTLGYFLKKFYKEKYYALGFDFYNGSFQSMDMKSDLVEFHYVLKQNSTGYLFSQSRNKIFFIDFACAEKNKDMNKILHDTIPSICIGALFSKEDPEPFYINRPLADIYDGMIFIRNTSRAEPNYNFKQKETSDFGNLMSRTDAKPYIGKQFKFSAFVKTGAKTTNGQGQLWCRVDKEDKSMGFFDNMGDRPVKSKEWQYYEITGTIDKDAAWLYFGCMFIGKGELFVDDITLFFQGKGQWLPVTLPDPTFESCIENKKPETWRIYDKNYKISVTGQTSHGGIKCLKFKR